MSYSARNASNYRQLVARFDIRVLAGGMVPKCLTRHRCASLHSPFI